MEIENEQINYVETVRILLHQVNDATCAPALDAAKKIITLVENRNGQSDFGEIVELIIPRYCKLIRESEPTFISERPRQKLRKLLLDTLFRLPATDVAVKRHEPEISILCFSLIENDNEENVQIALKIVVELYKLCRPNNSKEVRQFLQRVRRMYENLPQAMDYMFENTTRIPMDGTLPDHTKIGKITKVEFKIDNQGNPCLNGTKVVKRTIIPKATNSLLVLIDIPIAVVLMFQLYRESIEDIFKLIISTLLLKPSQRAKESETFNKDLFITLIGVQVKTLSLVAYFVRIYDQEIMQYSDQLLLGMLNIMKSCPPEATPYRKELLIAIRHISSTALKDKFVPHLEALFNDDVLFGQGLTVKENLRALGYHVIAELVHQVRNQLSYQTLSSATYTFLTNLHDDSLQLPVHTVSAKLLTNLVDCIRQKKADGQTTNNEARILLLRIFRSFTERLQTLAKYCLQELKMDEKNHAGETKQSDQIYIENKTLLKFLVLGANQVTLALFQSSRHNMTDTKNEFTAEERKLYIKFGKNALRAFELYLVHPLSGTSDSREKELKETLDHFAKTFIILPLAGFSEVWETLMDFLVEKMQENILLHTFAHPILTSKTYSFAFSSILVKYVINKLTDMGVPGKCSQLYLLLFKHLFGTVIHLRGENEEMLRPHLEDIVNGALDNAITAKDPENYFMLLRSLFRSISGGVHERLYQEFLPLLPRLLRQMNQLQAALHRPEMHDLFIELCLTVPVRLSFLLPHMERLMEPLVAALKGTQSLVSQGLRTLELFIDNLQQEFLQVKIIPVRAQLMRALWDIINRDDIIRKTKDKEQSAVAAFRILGKLGGENRSTIREPAQLKWKLFDSPGILVKLVIEPHKVVIPLDNIIDATVETMQKKVISAETWKFTTQLLLHVLYTLILREDEEHLIEYRVACNFQEFMLDERLITSYINLIVNGHGIQNGKNSSNYYFGRILSGLLFSMDSVNETMKQEVMSALKLLVRHFVIVDAVNIYHVMKTGNINIESFDSTKSMDLSLVSMIDALFNVLNLNTAKTEETAANIIEIFDHALSTGTRIMGCVERCLQLPTIAIFSKCVMENCYQRAWYSKLGACVILDFMIENMPIIWLEEHDYSIFAALMFVTRDLCQQVSFGVVDFAMQCMNKLIAQLIKKSSKPLNKLILKELVKEIISASYVVRNFSQTTLDSVARQINCTVSSIIEQQIAEKPDLLLICPKQGKMFHKSIPLQIGILDGTRYCLDLKPQPLIVFDWENSKDTHSFLHDVYKIMSGDEKYLDQSCYRKWLARNEQGWNNSLKSLTIAAMRVMARCFYVSEIRVKIFQALFQKMTNPVDAELMKAGEECLEVFLLGTRQNPEYDIPREEIHKELRPTLIKIGDYETLNHVIVERLVILSRLFQNTFNQKLCDTMMAHLKSALNKMVTESNSGTINPDLIKMCAAICEFFPLIQQSNKNFLEELLIVIVEAEEALGFTFDTLHPHLTKFCCKRTSLNYKSIEIFLTEDRLAQSGWHQLLINILKQESPEGELIRTACEGHTPKLIQIGLSHNIAEVYQNKLRANVQFRVIEIIYLLAKFHPEYLNNQHSLLDHLKNIWKNSHFRSRYKPMHIAPNSVNYREAISIARIFLITVETNPEMAEYLFQLQRINQMRTLAQFGKIKFWFKHRLMKLYAVSQQRTVVTRFLMNWHKKKTYENELKAFVIINVIIPIFEYNLKEGSLTQLLGEINYNNEEDLVGQMIKTMIEAQMEGSTDILNVAILKLSHFLIKHCSNYVVQYGDPDNGFRFNRILEIGKSFTDVQNPIDPSTEMNGYLLIAHMISKYILPKDLLLVSFERLLKSYSLEIKVIVNEAIDILVTEIHNIAISSENPEDQDMLPRYTRKVLMEEALTLRAIALTSHVVQVIQRHGDKYYATRAKHKLIPLLVNIMNKLGTSNTGEHRQLSVKLAALLVDWQKRSVEENKRGITEKRHGDSIIHFIIKSMISYFSNTSPSIKSEMLNKCKAIFSNIYRYQLWPEVSIRSGVFERYLDLGDGNEEKFSQAASALLTLAELVRAVPETLNEIIRLQSSLKTLITKISDKRIRPAICELIREIVAKYPGAFCGIQEKNCLKQAILTQINDGLSQPEANSDQSCDIKKTIELIEAAKLIPELMDEITPNLVKIFIKLFKDHTSSNRPEERQNTIQVISSLIKLMMNQVQYCNSDNRKSYLMNIVNLIEKTESIQILDLIIDSVQLWIDGNLLTNKERWNVMHKLFTAIKIRLAEISDDVCNAQVKYLDIVYRIYLNEQGSTSGNQTELLNKLEAPFLWGLTYPKASVRQKFFSLYDEWVPKPINERLLFIFATQSWEQLNADFIPVALALLLSSLRSASFDKNHRVSLYKSFAAFDLIRSSQNKDFEPKFQELLSDHYDDIGSFWFDFKPEVMIDNAMELSHCQSGIGRVLWETIFPLIWKLVPDKHCSFIANHIRQFICSSHNANHISDIASVIISATTLNIDIKPYQWRYLASNYALQGLAITHLEAKWSHSIVKKDEIEEPPGQSHSDVLSFLYKQIGEHTWDTCVWEERSQDSNTPLSMSLMEQNKFDESQQLLEKMMQCEIEKGSPTTAVKMNAEYDLWRENWIRCCKELNSWEAVCEHAQKSKDAYLVAQCAWKLPDTWECMKQAVSALEQACPPNLTWKVHLYKGYLAIRRYQEPPDSTFDLAVIEKHAKLASNEAIKAWRRLPSIVSVSHADLLRGAHQIVELNEAAQIHDSLSPSKINTDCAKEQIKDTVKRWKNRVPLYSDPYSHWSDLVVWHHHQYQTIVTKYEFAGIDHNIGMHASATDLIYYARIARKQGQLSSALDSLQFISDIPSLTANDCFIRIIEQIKCYLGAKSVDDRSNLQVIEDTSLRYFKTYEQSEILALKAKLQFKAKLPNVDPNKTFSQAVQQYDSHVAWGLWAEHLVQETLDQTVGQTAISVASNAASALAALLQACRQQNDQHCRKYMANVIYCLSWDNEPAVLEVLDQISDSVPPIQWLPWISQLITSLCRSPPGMADEVAERREKRLTKIICNVGKQYTQAVYLPMRTQYLTLKMEHTHATNQRQALLMKKMQRCSSIMGNLRDEFPPILGSVERIIDQMLRELKETWYEKLIREMRSLVFRLQEIQYKNTNSRYFPTEQVYDEFGQNLRRIVQEFAKEPLNCSDEVMVKLRDEFPRDLQLQFLLDADTVNINQISNSIGSILLPKLKKWIKKLELKVKNAPNYLVIDTNKCLDEDVEVPGESMNPRDPRNFVKLTKVLPIVNIVDRYDAIGKEISFLGNNGRVYSYLYMSQEQSVQSPLHIETRREERVCQLQRLLTPLLAKHRRTSWRAIDVHSLKIIPVAPLVRLVQSVDGVSLYSIYQQSILRKGDPQGPLHFYYSKIKSPIARNQHPPGDLVLRDVFQNIQENYVSPYILSEWARETYGNRIEYISFKSKFLYSIATQVVLSMGFGLCAVHPDQWLIERSTGAIYVQGQKMENHRTFQPAFRLTPSISHFTQVCNSRHALVEAIQAASCSILHNSFTISGITRAILRDEELKRNEAEMSSSQLTSSIRGRSQHIIASLENNNKDAARVTKQAVNTSVLARSNPALFPWL